MNRKKNSSRHEKKFFHIDTTQKRMLLQRKYVFEDYYSEKA